jgi:aryl carrier-like protein
MSKMAEIDMMLQDLAEHMSLHDWYYTYSDDHGVWQRGLDSVKIMTAKMNELKELGFEAQVDELWESNCPWGLVARREEIRQKLMTGPCKVTFTKVNGDERTMVCTLKPDLLPQVEQVESKPVKKLSESIAVFLPEEQVWRSFRVHSVKSIVATSL